jgi:hypothetical protein
VVPVASASPDRAGPGRDAPARPRSERGAGLLGAALGVAMVAALIGLSANVALGLWTRSTVESVVDDAARRIAATPVDRREAAAPAALASARQLLGPHGRRLHLEVRSVAPDVVVEVRSPGVALLPRLVHRRVAVGALDRRIVVHGERPAL